MTPTEATPPVPEARPKARRSDTDARPRRDPFAAVRQKVRGVAHTIVKYGQRLNHVGSLLVQLKEKPTRFNAFGIATSVATTVADMLDVQEVKPDYTELLETCEQLSIPGLNLDSIFNEYKLATLPDEYEWGDLWYEVHFADVRMFMRSDTEGTTLWVQGSADSVRAKLHAHIWEKYNHAVTVTLAGSDSWNSPFSLSATPQELALPSAKAYEIWARLEPFIRGNCPWSAIVDGRPGTGKSTLIRWIAKQVGGPVLRIPAADLGSLKPEAVCSLVDFLRPSVVMIDDFDRAGGYGKMLEMIERVREKVRLLIATTNSLDYVEPAMLRPQRFDELFTVESLGDDFATTYIGPVWERLSDESKSKVLLWPMAYLKTFDLIVKHHPATDVDEEVAKLDKRLAARKVPKWARLAAAFKEEGDDDDD